MLPFVNVKRLVLIHLRAELGGVPVRSDLPTPLDPHVPLVRVFRAPGSENEHTSTARLDLHSFALDEGEMWDLAGRTHAAMGRLSGRVIDGHRFDVVRVVQDPSDLPWSETVQRAVAVYDVPVRPAMMNPTGPALAGA